MLPGEESLRALVSTYARLRTALGDAVGEPDLVQPDGDFFPDAFAPDPPGVARLFARMLTHSPLADDLPVELRFVAGGDEEHVGGCGSGGCGARAGGRAGAGTVEDLGGRYRLDVPAADVGHPVLLTTALARGIGALVLAERGVEGEVGDAGGPAAAEICAAACGFGVLVAAGSRVWHKGCGGLTGIQATALSVEESATALALFVALHGRKPSAARRHLEPTPCEAFDEAWLWVESNPMLVDALRRNPSWLSGGAFDLEPSRGALGRWLHRRRVERELRAAPVRSARPAAPPSPARLRHLEVARALVDETFDETFGDR